VNYQADSTALRLRAFLSCWLAEHPSWAYQGPPWAQQRRSARDIANDLLQEAEFREIQLATWVRSPDGALIAQVVTWVLPPTQALEFQLLVDAISVAADAKHRDEQQRAATVGAIGLVVLIIYGIWKSRGS
jgi:hypothetical protein